MCWTSAPACPWLDVLQDAGWETWGVEPGPAQRELAAQRHRIIEAPGAEQQFDLIILNHVLEHLRAPRPVLEQLAAALRPGGLLFVSVP